MAATTKERLTRSDPGIELADGQVLEMGDLPSREERVADYKAALEAEHALANRPVKHDPGIHIPAEARTLGVSTQLDRIEKMLTELLTELLAR